MSEIKDISETINLQTSSEEIIVSLQANQYTLDCLEQYQFILEQKTNLLQGKIIEATEENLTLSYTKNPYAIAVADSVKKMSLIERLRLAQKMTFLNLFYNTTLQPFIHPKNLFLLGEEVSIGHRGFMNFIVPHTASHETYFKQYRALILFVLQPKHSYEALIEGAGTLQDPLSKQIQAAESIEAIDQLISEQVIIQQMKLDRQSKQVKKKNYELFKWGSAVLLITTIILGVLLGRDEMNKIPTKDRIITAETKYIANDYASVLSTLKNDTPEDLPTGAQYVYAVSAIQLDNLTNEQKEAILNNTSQKSNENTLLYWIYIGRGKFEKALDIAQNIGDNQLILHAYTKLYDATKLDSKMNGEKKQENLKKYEEEITKYMKLLGGQTNETESSE